MKKVKGLIIMLLISLSLFGMTACDGENGKASTYEQITAEQAKTIMDTEKDCVIIDARTEEEFAEGHIENAILIIVWYNYFNDKKITEEIMMEFIVPFIVGVVLIVLGISNMRGNISSLHSYHRHRVSEEDRIPFGKQVGLGTVIIGVGIIIFSILSAITLYTENNIFVLIGTAVLIVGIIVGLVLSFKAMIKYNKGIF